jgi:hypothetical protein
MPHVIEIGKRGGKIVGHQSDGTPIYGKDTPDHQHTEAHRASHREWKTRWESRGAGRFNQKVVERRADEPVHGAVLPGNWDTDGSHKFGQRISEHIDYAGHRPVTKYMLRSGATSDDIYGTRAWDFSGLHHGATHESIHDTIDEAQAAADKHAKKWEAEHAKRVAEHAKTSSARNARLENAGTHSHEAVEGARIKLVKDVANDVKLAVYQVVDHPEIEEFSHTNGHPGVTIHWRDWDFPKDEYDESGHSQDERFAKKRSAIMDALKKSFGAKLADVDVQIYRGDKNYFEASVEAKPHGEFGMDKPAPGSTPTPKPPVEVKKPADVGTKPPERGDAREKYESLKTSAQEAENGVEAAYKRGDNAEASRLHKKAAHLFGQAAAHNADHAVGTTAERKLLESAAQHHHAVADDAARKAAEKPAPKPEPRPDVKPPEPKPEPKKTTSLSVGRDPRLPDKGTEVKKTWRGKNVVLVENDNGQFHLFVDGAEHGVYSSPSKAASTLMGSPQNGYLFFGLNKKG